MATEGDTLRTVHCRGYNQVVCHLVIRGSGQLFCLQF